MSFSNRRKIIVEKLNQIDGFKCPKPGGAFYAFPNISGTGYKSNELQKKFLEEAGVALISGNSFGHLGEGYLRFSYANSEKNIITAIVIITFMIFLFFFTLYNTGVFDRAI